MSMPAAATATAHVPVLLTEIVATLAPRDGAIYVDGTFGAGGYARALLDSAACRVIGIDRDPAAIARGKEMEARYTGRFAVIQGRFAEMEALLGRRAIAAVDGIALDLGVSSMQLDEPERGFSFQQDGPLDMRMGNEGPTAADVVNSASERELSHILRRYGEERQAGRIARAIVAARAEAPILRTRALAEIVERTIGRGPRREHGPSIHPATRSFQALRIYVNRELEELAEGLAAAERLLRPGGRLAVVSFHSLEDRIVKRFLSARSGRAPHPSRHAPPPGAEAAPSFQLLFQGARQPDAAEIAANPRARSARLRAALRTGAPAWPLDAAALGVESEDFRLGRRIVH